MYYDYITIRSPKSKLKSVPFADPDVTPAKRSFGLNLFYKFFDKVSLV